MRRLLRNASLTLVALVVLAVVAAWVLATASLARRDGSAVVAGLGAGVDIELDDLGIPRIRAATLADAYRAEGFLHAEERFFQMDLTRRSAAGELAGLVGARALPVDRRQAPYEFRRRAGEWLTRLPARHRAWLEAYAEGVNAGLADLGARPPEYFVLGRKPEPWRAEDSLLVVYAIYTMLSNNEAYERPQAVMAATLPPSVFALLTPTASRDDRPLLAPPSDRTGGYRPLPLPDAATLDLRGRAAPPPDVIDPPLMGQAASNEWAVGAGQTARHVAILANDPHLGYQLPNLFYRAELYWPDHVVRGVSVPGLPGILIGANAAVAWGATVSYADQSDWVVVVPDPDDPDRYLTPDGSAPFDVTTVRIGGGAATADVEIRRTRFGPIVGADGLGRPLALKATWLEPDGVSLDLIELAGAGSVAAAREIIGRWAGPALSWGLAGSDGTVGWALNGPMPERVGFDGSTPADWSDGSRYWAGYRPLPGFGGERDGIVYNANNRSLPLGAAEQMSRMYMRPHRAERIESLLEGATGLDETALFQMQLDTDAHAYEPIRQLILASVPAEETAPALASARRAALAWSGRSDADSHEFALLQSVYLTLLRRVLAPVVEPAVAADPAFVYRWPLAEESLFRILDERPPNLLPAGFDDWTAFLRDGIREAAAATDTTRAWGEDNRLDVGHPLAGLPVIGRWLRLPADPQPGSAVSIRVATPRRGSVFRMVVAPAEPEAGIFEMLGGQSGHFLSPNFIDQHYDWAAGVPAPFLAGRTAASFRLEPE